jgi:hypothetical protein
MASLLRRYRKRSNGIEIDFQKRFYDSAHRRRVGRFKVTKCDLKRPPRRINPMTLDPEKTVSVEDVKSQMRITTVRILL